MECSASPENVVVSVAWLLLRIADTIALQLHNIFAISSLVLNTFKFNNEFSFLMLATLYFENYFI